MKQKLKIKHETIMVDITKPLKDLFLSIKKCRDFCMKHGSASQNLKQFHSLFQKVIYKTDNVIEILKKMNNKEEPSAEFLTTETYKKNETLDITLSSAILKKFLDTPTFFIKVLASLCLDAQVIELGLKILKINKLFEQNLNEVYKNPEFVADILFSIGCSYLQLKKYELSQAFLFDSLELCSTFSLDGSGKILQQKQQIYESLATLAFKQGKIKYAKVFLARAKNCYMKLRKSNLHCSMEELIVHQKQLGLYHYHEKNFASSLKYFNESITFANECIDYYQIDQRDEELQKIQMTHQMGKMLLEKIKKEKAVLVTLHNTIKILYLNSLTDFFNTPQLINLLDTLKFNVSLSKEKFTIDITSSITSNFNLFIKALEIYKISHEDCKNANTIIINIGEFNNSKFVSVLEFTIKELNQIAHDRQTPDIYRPDTAHNSKTTDTYQPTLSLNNNNNVKTQKHLEDRQTNIRLPFIKDDKKDVTTNQNEQPQSPQKSGRFIKFGDVTYDLETNDCIVKLWSNHLPDNVLYAKFAEEELTNSFDKEKIPLTTLQEFKKDIFAKGHIVGPVNEKGFKYSKNENTAPYFFKMKKPNNKIRIWGRLAEIEERKELWIFDKVSFNK